MKQCPQCQIKYPDALEICPKDGTTLPGSALRPAKSSVDPYIGSTIDGRYLIEAKLGEGGMGVVYAARHVIIDKRVAIKILKKEAQEEETAAQRFIQEAKSASKIGQGNIVDITDFGVLPDGSAYFVMEFLEGQTLGNLLAKGPLPSMRVIHIASQVARALHAAHQKGIVHRDLKPDNVFLLEREGQQDFVKIVDFGIAKVQAGPLGASAQRLTQVGMVLGTPEYMSPEQATGKETDHRVDEYALGCIMYEMLTGDVPYRAETSAGILTKHVFEAPVAPRQRRPDLDILPALEAAVIKAMGKRREDRFPSMKDLVDALEQAARTAPLPVGADRPTRMAAATASSPSARRSKRRTLLFASLGAASAAAVIVLVFVAARRRDQPPQVIVVEKPVVRQVLITDGAVQAPSDVKLTLRSNPDKAEVYAGDDLIGRTPVTYQSPPSDTAIVFTFRLAGYKDAQRELVPDQSRDVEVPLAKRESRHASGPRGADGKPERKGDPARGSSELRDPF